MLHFPIRALQKISISIKYFYFSSLLYYIKATMPKEQVILSVTSKNSIRYKGNEYVLPKGKLKEKERVRVEERDNNIYIYQALTNEFLLKHAIPTGEGKNGCLNLIL